VTRDFWLDLIERAGKTFAQALIATLTVQGISGVLDVDWGRALSVTALATLVSVLTSLLSLKLGHTGTASATSAVVPHGRHAALEAGVKAAGLNPGPVD
jgi:hypothetical protein